MGNGLLKVIDALGHTILQLEAMVEEQRQRIELLETQLAGVKEGDDGN